MHGTVHPSTPSRYANRGGRETAIIVCSDNVPIIVHYICITYKESVINSI